MLNQANFRDKSIQISDNTICQFASLRDRILADEPRFCINPCALGCHPLCANPSCPKLQQFSKNLRVHPCDLNEKYV